MWYISLIVEIDGCRTGNEITTTRYDSTQETGAYYHVPVFFISDLNLEVNTGINIEQCSANIDKVEKRKKQRRTTRKNKGPKVK